MKSTPFSPEDYLQMDETTFWETFGQTVREHRLGVLPEEESPDTPDADVGQSWFRRQLKNIRALYCSEKVRSMVQDPKKHDVTTFCATLIDLFAAYFSKPAATMILVQIYKIGADRICDETS